MEPKSLLTNCGLLSVNKYATMPDGMINCSRNTFFIWADVYVDVEIGCVDMEYLSMITKTE